MTTLRDAAQQALEALIAATPVKAKDPQMQADAIVALRAALAEPAEQEPVAWKHDCAALLTNDVELWIDACPHCGKPRPAPQPKPAEQEPVRGEWQGYTWNPYAVSQPKAEPLTNLEGLKLAYNHHWINNLSLRDAFLQGIRDAEAAHGITKTSPRSKT